MADKEWVTIQPDLSKLLEPVNKVIAAIDGVLSALIAILNIVQVILNVIKAFLLGFLDPIRAIIEAIIAEIRNIIHDLKNLGGYFIGDIGLCKSPFLELRGGFSAFERRSLRRLLDTRDPNRPDFTTSSGVMAVFFYMSSQDIGELIAFILRLLKFFGQLGDVSPFPAPVNLGITYGVTTNVLGLTGYSALSEASFSDGVPDSVKISWSIPPPRGFFGFTPQPKGFLIEISTFPDGQGVVGRIPRDDLSSNPNVPPSVWRPATDPTTNGVLRSYSGATLFGPSIGTLATLSYNNPQCVNLYLMSDSNSIPWLIGDAAGEGVNGAAFYVKAGFMSSVLPSQEFSVVVKTQHLPKKWKMGSDMVTLHDEPLFRGPYSVRVRAIGKDINDYVEGRYLSVGSGTIADPYVLKLGDLPLWNFTVESLTAAKTALLKPVLPMGSNGPDFTLCMSAPSQSLEFSMPNEKMGKYIETVQAAILITILCRLELPSGAFYNPDNPVEDYFIAYAGTANEEIKARLAGKEGAGAIKRSEVFSTGCVAPWFRSGTAAGFPSSLRDFAQKAFPLFNVTPRFFNGVYPDTFRKKVKNVLLLVARKLIEAGPPTDELIDLVVAHYDTLVGIEVSTLVYEYDPTWRLLMKGGTLMNFIGFGSHDDKPSETDLYGIGANPMCRSLPKETLEQWYTSSGGITVDSPKSTTPGPARGWSFMVSDSLIISQSVGTMAHTNFVMGEGSADFSPIFYSDDSEQKSSAFIRNVIYDYDQAQDDATKKLGTSAAEVLQIASVGLLRGVGDSEWVAFRILGNQLVPLEELLDKIEKFLLGILDMLQGMIDKIIAYIEAIQARIYQLQALINMIRALLNALSMFTLPSLSGLVLVEAGTAGIVSGLMSATNKPVDSSAAYGAGVTLVAGGMPLILLELIAAIFPKVEESSLTE